MNRDNLLDKIRALMSKTVDNGCTEHEALAALDKARAMMDAYEVGDDELKLAAEQSAILHSNGAADPHGIKSMLGMAIAEFCDCKVWKGANGLVFCGLPSDAQFADWLINNLASFVQSELAQHLMGSLAPKGRRRFQINGFVGGACTRISGRLRDLCAESAVVISSNSRALVIAKGTAVADKMKAEGIKLGRSRRSSRKSDYASYAAGQSVGDRASFGRPISGSSQRMIGGCP